MKQKVYKFHFLVTANLFFGFLVNTYTTCLQTSSQNQATKSKKQTNLVIPYFHKSVICSRYKVWLLSSMKVVNTVYTLVNKKEGLTTWCLPHMYSVHVQVSDKKQNKTKQKRFLQRREFLHLSRH